MRCRKLASQLATDLYRTWAKDNPQEAREAADGVTSEVSTSLVGEPPGSPRLSCSVFLPEWFVPSNVCWENEREHEPRQHAGMSSSSQSLPLPPVGEIIASAMPEYEDSLQLYENSLQDSLQLCEHPGSLAKLVFDRRSRSFKLSFVD